MRAFTSVYYRYFTRSFPLHVQDDVGEGPVIIFLHGIASSSRNWEHLIPRLSKDYRCITIDLLGFGASPKPTLIDYSIEQHVRSIHRTARRLKLRQPYILVGHSLGSLLACRYARRYPAEITRLVMLSPPIYFHHTQYGRRRIKQTAGAYMKLYRFVRSHKKFTLTNLARLARIVPPLASMQLTEENWLPFVRSLENCIETQTVITDIAEVPAPVDIFYGTRDQVIVASNLKVVASMRHITIHPVKGATHFVRATYAKEVTAHLHTTR